jgi:hypothetical protein
MPSLYQRPYITPISLETRMKNRGNAICLAARGDFDEARDDFDEARGDFDRASHQF